MARRRIRIGVAGLGRIGWRFHCARIGGSRDFELAAVSDTDAARRREAESCYGCRAFADYGAMLAEGNLEAVTIATPTHFHKSHALAAYRRGLHVFLEKPIGCNAAEAEAIVRAAKRAGRVLTLYQSQRAAAWFQQVRRIAASGRIGTVYHVRTGLFGYRRRNDWQSLERFGGGMLRNYGAHCLDHALVLTGYDVKKVFCTLRRVASLGDTEDVVKIVYETRGGVVGEVDINQACALPPYEFEVYGTTGAVAKEGKTLRVRYFSARGLRRKKLDASLASGGRRYPSDAIRFREKVVAVDARYEVDVYKDFARAIRTGSAPFVTAKEALAVMKLMERCRRDAGRVVETRLDG